MLSTIIVPLDACGMLPARTRSATNGAYDTLACFIARMISDRNPCTEYQDQEDSRFAVKKVDHAHASLHCDLRRIATQPSPMSGWLGNFLQTIIRRSYRASPLALYVDLKSTRHTSKYCFRCCCTYADAHVEIAQQE